MYRNATRTGALKTTTTLIAHRCKTYPGKPRAADFLLHTYPWNIAPGTLSTPTIVGRNNQKFLPKGGGAEE